MRTNKVLWNLVESLGDEKAYDVIKTLSHKHAYEVYLFFLRNPDDAFTSREIIEYLDICSHSGYYRSIKRLLGSNLIVVSGYYEDYGAGTPARLLKLNKGVV